VDSFSLQLEHVDEEEESSSKSSDLKSETEIGLVGQSSQMQVLKINIANLAPLSAPVLITGETGTGKELVSRGLHLCSGRSSGLFVAVNCGGLTDSLMEDTLFGHKRGAFTGAMDGRKGVFEQADGGTLFLDEIGELPISQQAALLRVLDDKMVKRIGDDRSKPVDFRLVAATNKDLGKAVEKGEFRNDLFHRISALALSTTPLRDRPMDIGALAKHFLTQMSDEIGYRSLDESAAQKLETYNWPGNARELRNVLYRAAAFSRSEVMTARNFELGQLKSKPRQKPFRLDELPDIQIEQALERADGNVAAAARKLGVPRSSLRDKVNRLCEDSHSLRVNRRAS
jgi:DNA-binding NtrC family response regulator